MKRGKLGRPKHSHPAGRWHEGGPQRHPESGLLPGLPLHTWGWRAKKTFTVPSLPAQAPGPKRGADDIITASQEGAGEVSSPEQDPPTPNDGLASPPLPFLVLCPVPAVCLSACLELCFPICKEAVWRV